MTLSFHDAEKKIQWERERVAKDIAHTNEKFKRFIPQRKSLGYVESSSEKSVQPYARSPHSPKTTCSEETEVAYINQKITQLYKKLQSSTG